MYGVKEDFQNCFSPGETRGTLSPNNLRRPAVPFGDMHYVKEGVHQCRSPPETWGTLAPNTERFPAVPFGDMQSVKEEFHQCWSPGEIRGTLAPNTGRLPAVPRRHMHGVKEDFRRHSRRTGHHAKLLLAFESCPVMVAILSKLCQAAASFFLTFYFLVVFSFVLSVVEALQYKDTSDWLRNSWSARKCNEHEQREFDPASQQTKK
jgi:hypothetical protein